MENQSRISIAKKFIQINLRKQNIIFPKISLPEEFTQWQSKSRIEMFKKLKKDGNRAVKVQQSHLPIITTLGKGKFPINSCNKRNGNPSQTSFS